MIKGKRVVLRELRTSDLPSVNRWRNNLENRILTQGYRGPVSMEIDSDWLKGVLSDSDNKNIYFGIEKASSDKIIGIIQLNGIDYISGVSTCGILIGENEERLKGFGTDAVRAILYYAFFVLNLRKVITYIAAFNKPSFKLQEKVGKVHKEGCLKEHYYYNGEYTDLHIQSFFKNDYKSLKDDFEILNNEHSV
jgi:[ribosomal protein S5]-alanine N-acetyltransferase